MFLSFCPKRTDGPVVIWSGRKLLCKLMPKIQNIKGLEKSGKTQNVMQTDG